MLLKTQGIFAYYRLALHSCSLPARPLVWWSGGVKDCYGTLAGRSWLKLFNKKLPWKVPLPSHVSLPDVEQEGTATGFSTAQVSLPGAGEG